jgi:hypothetical protein
MDSLLRSSASVVGITNEHVSDNPRTNVQDGGVDTEISAPAVSADPWGYFGVLSAWQYKAVQLSDLTDAEVRGEIEKPSKTYIRDLIGRGYGYRLCVAHDGTAERKREIKDILDAAIAKINPSAPKAIVLFAADIVAWTNAFPALAATMLGTELSGFRLFDTWRINETAKTPTFVATGQTTQIRDRVREYLDWSRKPSTSKLTISGDAGIGKTRTVFEAVAETPDARGLVFYTDDEDSALQLAQNLANHHDTYAVLVADECVDSVAFQIGRILQGFEQRLRLITIDNALDITDQTDLRLTPLAFDKVEEVLNENFPQVEASRRFRYCELAGGFLRFAISLCENDALIQEQGHYGQPLRDVQSYLGALFGHGGPLDAVDRAALDLIALVERCGVLGNVSNELEQLCALAPLDAREVAARLHRMQKSTGLVGKAGRYFYVTPTPIATVCFQSAWNRWAEPDTKRFLEAFPRNLTPGLLSRVSRASTEVGKVVTAYFRDWIVSRGPDIFSTEADTEQLLLLVQAHPDQMMNRLRALVLTATPEQLAPGYHRGRRLLVTELVEVARFPEWFAAAEEMLFTLAKHESEPNLGNNATKVWAALYGITDSAIATPFPARMEILRGRSRASEKRVRELCITALTEAVDDRAIHLISSLSFGRRIPPTAWYPKTWGDYFACLKDCLALLSQLCADEDADIREKAVTAFVGSIRHALFKNIKEPAKEGAGVVPANVRPVLRAELRELVLLNQNYTSEEGEGGEEVRKEKIAFIEAWIEELTSVELHDQLVEEIGPASWSHHLEQADWETRLNHLADRILTEEGALQAELGWLNSAAAGSAVDLGVRIGRGDTNLSYLDLLVESCTQTRRADFMRGYFVGVAEIFGRDGNADLRTKCNAALDVLWEVDPALGFDSMLPSGDFLSSFERAIHAVSDRRLPAGALRALVAWNGPRPTSMEEARVAAEVLLTAAKSGDNRAASTGIDFIHFALLRSKPDTPVEYLIGMFGDETLEVPFGLLEESIDGKKAFSHWFPRMFQIVMPANPARAIQLEIATLGSDNYEASQAASGLLHSIAELDGSLLMAQLGQAMLEGRGKIHFVIRKISISIFPPEIVIAWLKEKGLEGARVLARHVAPPFIGPNGPELNPVTAYLMENFGDDERAFSSFLAGLHSGGVFTGAISDWMQRGVTLAEQFLNYPIPSVRKWAQAEVDFTSQQVEEFREREEEEGFV